MIALAHLPEAADLASSRLDLEPLRVTHAEEMARVLNDVALHEFIGGAPATADELRSRYSHQVLGRSPDGSQRWFNWVLRRRSDGQAVGTVQATVSLQQEIVTAEVAWVIGTNHQAQGYAREAAGAMVAWLQACGIAQIVAHVHPDHPASQAVARAMGLSPTTTVVDGEVQWRHPLFPNAPDCGLNPDPRR